MSESGEQFPNYASSSTSSSSVVTLPKHDPHHRDLAKAIRKRMFRKTKVRGQRMTRKRRKWSDKDPYVT